MYVILMKGLVFSMVVFVAMMTDFIYFIGHCMHFIARNIIKFIEEEYINENSNVDNMLCCLIILACAFWYFYYETGCVDARRRQQREIVLGEDLKPFLFFGQADVPIQQQQKDNKDENSRPKRRAMSFTFGMDSLQFSKKLQAKVAVKAEQDTEEEKLQQQLACNSCLVNRKQVCNLPCGHLTTCFLCNFKLIRERIRRPGYILGGRIAHDRQ